MIDGETIARVAREREAIQIAAWLRGMPYSASFQSWPWQLAYTLFGGYWRALCDLVEMRCHDRDR